MTGNYQKMLKVSESAEQAAEEASFELQKFI